MDEFLWETTLLEWVLISTWEQKGRFPTSEGTCVQYICCMYPEIACVCNNCQYSSRMGDANTNARWNEPLCFKYSFTPTYICNWLASEAEIQLADAGVAWFSIHNNLWSGIQVWNQSVQILNWFKCALTKEKQIHLCLC